MQELYFLVEEQPDGGYTARTLGESIFTQGDTLDEIRGNIREAVNCHFVENLPRIVRLHIVRDELLTNA